MSVCPSVRQSVCHTEFEFYVHVFFVANVARHVVLKPQSQVKATRSGQAHQASHSADWKWRSGQAHQASHSADWKWQSKFNIINRSIDISMLVIVDQCNSHVTSENFILLKMTTKDMIWRRRRRRRRGNSGWDNVSMPFSTVSMPVLNTRTMITIC